MEQLVLLFKTIPILIAAILLGNWFLSELKRTNAAGKPWYTAYLSVPGLLILLAVLVVPCLAWLTNH